MPTYDYRCDSCDEERSIIQTMGEYCRNPVRPVCIQCGNQMERRLSVSPLMSGIQNALAGDNHYRGLCVPGTDQLIDTRTKHRQYMKDNNLSMAEDWKGEWSKAEKERTAMRTLKRQDPSLRKEITEQVMKAVAQS